MPDGDDKTQVFQAKSRAEQLGIQFLPQPTKVGWYWGENGEREEIGDGT